MLYSVMITVLIAFAVIGIFCGKALRLDKCRRRVKSYIVIPCTCSDRELELLVKGCWWDEVCAGKNCARDIIILFGDGEDFSEALRLLRHGTDPDGGDALNEKSSETDTAAPEAPVEGDIIDNNLDNDQREDL